jgi:hypothetical protein
LISHYSEALRLFHIVTPSVTRAATVAGRPMPIPVPRAILSDVEKPPVPSGVVVGAVVVAAVGAGLGAGVVAVVFSAFWPVSVVAATLRSRVEITVCVKTKVFVAVKSQAIKPTNELSAQANRL